MAVTYMLAGACVVMMREPVPARMRR